MLARPLMIIALLLAIMGAVFLVAHIAEGTVLWLFVAALILAIIGALTGK